MPSTHSAIGVFAVRIASLAAALGLYSTGSLNMREALGGFGDPLIVFVTSLLAIGARLEATTR